MAAVEATRDGQTALALRLLKYLAPAPSGSASKNVAFSPLCVHSALALVAAGAGGATLAQLLAFLGASSASDLAAFGRRVTGLVLHDQSGPRVLFGGGGVWVDASRGALSKEFRDVAANSYMSEARTVNFSKKPVEAAAMINDWVKKATENLIGTVISTDDITGATDVLGLVLANAVYFKGEWVEPFNLLFTKPDTFHRLDGVDVEARFMHNFQSLKVSCMDGFKVVSLPYKWWSRPRAAVKASSPDNRDTRYSMFVFLPDENHGLATMVDVITAAPGHLHSILSKMDSKLVQLKLPKFKINFNWDLKTGLCKLGLSLPFSPEVADLRGVYEDGAGRRPTFLDKVAHTAVVKVDEAGTEAAAATMVMMCGGGPGGGPPPDFVEFVADHPFTFLIMEDKSGVIVFAGHVFEPTK